MADGDDLPDADYESIYGAEAMRARTLARMANIERISEKLLAEMQVTNAQMRAIKEVPPPAPETKEHP